MAQINLMEVNSYYDLSIIEREQIVIAVSKPKNFFNTFFNQLKNARTMVECFNKLNELHYDIYAEYMYSTYASFQIVYSKHIKKSRR